ncbi:MAG: UbiA-like protein EboC [Bacteroidota bacterium]
MSDRLLGFLQLARPANILTAMADIAAGFAIASSVSGWSLGDPMPAQFYWLLLATVGLYGGGVVLNDFFDATLDATERPERPIPRGAVSRREAGFFGALLLGLGVIAAYQHNLTSAFIAIAIVLLVILYDAYAKHHVVFGPLVMGSCRGANLLLGVSAVTAALAPLWWIGFVPLIYIGGITLISQGEVHGGSARNLWIGLGLYGIAIGWLVSVRWVAPFDLLVAAPFLIVFLMIIIPPWRKAVKDLQAKQVGKAVKAGVLGLIPLNACFSAGFLGWPYGVAVLLLLPISLWIARKFAVS